MTLRVTTLAIAVVVSTASRTTGGRCAEGFNAVRDDFAALPGFQTMLATPPFGEDRSAFEPPQECTWSTSKGIHAFIAAQLQGALRAAKDTEGVAVADIGSGTGFLLDLFSQFVEEGVDVVGVDLDAGAVARAQWLKSHDLLNEKAKLVEGDGRTLTYHKKFAVINVGFASTWLPEHFFEIIADRATILMPICEDPLTVVDGKCKAIFHLFQTVAGISDMTVAQVGLIVNFLYVPLQ